MKIISYNVNSGIGPDKTRPPVPENSIRLLKKLDADIAALQEVALFHPKSPSVDYMKEAENFLKEYTCFGKTRTLPNGGSFGNALISKYPMEIMENFPLDFPPEAETRKALIVKVAAEKPFYMVSLHLAFQGEFENDDMARMEALKKLETHLMEKEYFPVILAGDFNNFPASPAINYMKNNWDIANFHNNDASLMPTANTRKYGWMHIDFIMSYPKNAFRCENFTVVDEYGASDHRPVMAELILK